MGTTIKKNVQSAVVNATLLYQENNPVENIPKLINVVKKLDVVADKLWLDSQADLESCKMEKGTA